MEYDSKACEKLIRISTKYLVSFLSKMLNIQYLYVRVKNVHRKKYIVKKVTIIMANFNRLGPNSPFGFAASKIYLSIKETVCQ